mmetsp:Transcript_12529/g.27012  ORF Transcript_12529/g.27012 Transcript_12529/m.27012 type:complete len:215 (-) Transcript_12529:948-1592(-)
MRQAHDHCLLYRRMYRQYRLHLAAVHVLAPALDHVLHAPHQPQAALRVQVTQVPGAQPAVSVQDLCVSHPRRLLRVIPVAQHDVRSACQHLSYLAHCAGGQLGQLSRCTIRDGAHSDLHASSRQASAAARACHVRDVVHWQGLGGKAGLGGCPGCVSLRRDCLSSELGHVDGLECGGCGPCGLHPAGGGVQCPEGDGGCRLGHTIGGVHAGTGE